MDIDKIYLINLESAVNRKEHFLQEAIREKLPQDKIKIFNAINGNEHIFTNFEL